MFKSKKIVDCYKLPWSEFDNPNGWIEPTSLCNIVCPGCYRGSDKNKHAAESLSLSELKKQIIWLKEHRNLHTLSIAGGEPLLYPHIRDLIAYATSLNLRTMLFTNGVLLNRNVAVELADSGLNQVVIHVDSFQKRPDMIKTSPFELKQKFVDDLKDIPQLQLGFIQPVSKNLEAEIALQLEFLKRNFSFVNLIVFTLYRNICESDKLAPELESNLNLTELINIIRTYDTIEPAAYLGSNSDTKEPTWLFAQRLGLNGVVLGNIPAWLYKFAHTRYREKSKRFLFISRSNNIKILSLLRFFYKITIVKTVTNYILHGIKTGKWNKGKVNFQTILLLRGPEMQNGNWDLCEGCPDRMIYNGKFIPSCILENLKGKKNEEFSNVNLRPKNL